MLPQDGLSCGAGGPSASLRCRPSCHTPEPVSTPSVGNSCQETEGQTLGTRCHPTRGDEVVGSQHP